MSPWLAGPVAGVLSENNDALITLDRPRRIDVKAEFYVRVRPDSESIVIAVQTLGHNAALRYRAQAPIVDGLMKELGFDGSSLDNLVAEAGGSMPRAAPAKPQAKDEAPPELPG